tara:strand:- start:93 stop:494 length:402 start_codon:yes stop_codon:yes gene_type:complete
MYGTPQERAQKNSRLSDYTLCENMVIATLAPQQIREEWATELQKRQTNCNQFAAQLNARVQSQRNNLALSQQLLEQSQPRTYDSFNNSSSDYFGSAIYKRSYVSGMNRICIYDNMGSDYTTTIGAAEMCPLNP